MYVHATYMCDSEKPLKMLQYFICICICIYIHTYKNCSAPPCDLEEASLILMNKDLHFSFKDLFILIA